MTRLFSRTTVVLIALASFGCDQGRTPSPDVPVIVVHAAPSYGALDFFRGRTAKAAQNLAFRSVQTQLAFDADQYEFHVNVQAPDRQIGAELVAFSRTLTPDNAYHIVIAESGGALTPIFVEQPVFPTDATNSEVSLVHAATFFGSVTAYVEPVGTALAGATPLGTAAFLDNLAPVTRPTGEYRLFLTQVGDPAMVLFESPTFTLAAGQSDVIVLTDGAGEGLAELAVVQANSRGAGFAYDVNEQSGVRFINAATDRAARDVYLDDDFTAPLVAGLAYNVPSAYETVPPGNRALDFTPAGNPSVVEHEGTQSLSIARLHTVIIAGDSSDLSAAAALENRRSVRDAAQLQIINGAGLFDNVEFYVMTPGTAITPLTLPLTVTTAPAISVFADVTPRDYELTIIDADTDTVLAGPTTLTLAAGGFYSVLALDAVGGSTIDVQLLDDFN